MFDPGPFSTIRAAGPSTRYEKYSMFTAKAISLAKPAISLSVPGFTPAVRNITVTLNNPNPAAVSGLVYWFAAVGETSAQPYTGTFTERREIHRRHEHALDSFGIRQSPRKNLALAKGK